MPENKIIISRWIGEFGNNLEQIASSICFAKCICGITEIYFPNYSNYTDLLNLNYKLILSKEYDYSIKEFDLIDWITNCYYTPALNYVGCDYKNLIVNEMANIFKNNIKPMLNFNILKNKFDINENTLTIHLRGGDILNLTHPLYQQSNVSWEFYKKILERKKYKKVIICKQDNLNPFYKEILKFCLEKNIEVDDKDRSFSECYYILAHSFNILVSGFSTFSLTASYMNENLNNFYYPLLAPKDQSHKEKFRLKILKKTQCKLNLYNKENSLVKL